MRAPSATPPALRPRRTMPRNSKGTHTHLSPYLFQSFSLSLNRDMKVYDRKVRKARAKANEALARRLLAAKPGVRLDHLVRER